MTGRDFAYQVVTRTTDPTEITSLIAYQAPLEGRLRAVLWSVPRGEWIYAPKIAAPLLYDQKTGRVRPVDRRTAERVARDVLGTELPEEETLSEISAEGEQLSWGYGPPRS